MPIVTLLQHLKNTQKSFTALTNTASLKNIKVSSYDVSPKSLHIFTDENHEIEIDITKFKEIKFDAIISSAKTSVDMLKRFTDLYDSKVYNAYLMDHDDNYILELYRIPSEYQ